MTGAECSAAVKEIKRYIREIALPKLVVPPLLEHVELANAKALEKRDDEERRSGAAVGDARSQAARQVRRRLRARAHV